MELIKAFHLMWDHYPKLCSLIHKSREVVAVNPACAHIDRKVGTICVQEQPPEKHAGCKANQALKTGDAQVLRRSKEDGAELLVFWLPVDGYPDFYPHFGKEAI
jgi:hypothetical protein